MVLAADKERVKTLLKDTITLLCRNGLTFKSKFSIEALIGVTLDDEDIFLVSINELIKNELCKSTEKSSSTEESAEESVSGEELQNKQHRSRKRKRAKHVKVKREPGASDMSDGGGFSEDGRGDDDQNGGPVIKKQPLDDNGVDEESGSITGHRLQVEQSFDETAENSNDEDSGDIVFIKQEMDTWSENAANASQANFNFSQGANRSQGDMNFSSLSDMNLVPVTSQEEGSMVWPSGGMQQRMPFPGRSATVTAGGSTQQSGDGQMAQQPHQMMDGSYCCEFCGRKYQTKYSYEAHVNAHKGIYRNICPYCQKGFYNKSDLQGHIVSHTGKKEFKCELCQKEYRYRSHLLQHMKIKHR